MVNSVLDALPHQAAALMGNFGIKIAPQDVRAERQGQSVCILPPSTKIDYGVKAVLAVSELRLMNHQAGICGAVMDRIENLVERRYDGFKIGLHKAQSQICRREFSRNSDAFAFE